MKSTIVFVGFGIFFIIFATVFTFVVLRYPIVILMFLVPIMILGAGQIACGLLQKRSQKKLRPIKIAGKILIIVAVLLSGFFLGPVLLSLVAL